MSPVESVCLVVRGGGEGGIGGWGGGWLGGQAGRGCEWGGDASEGGLGSIMNNFDIYPNKRKVILKCGMTISKSWWFRDIPHQPEWSCEWVEQGTA